jgi:hypothetical protein
MDNDLILDGILTSITGELKEEIFGDNSRTPISRICQCCGCGEDGSLTYEYVYKTYPGGGVKPNIPERRYSFDKEGCGIVVGVVEDTPSIGDRKHYIVESDGLKFLMVWDDV